MWIMTSKRNSGYRVAREPFYFQVRLSAGQQESVRNCQIWHPFVYIVSNEVVNFKEGVKLQLWINFTWNYSLQIFNCIRLRQCIMSRGQNIVVGDIEFVEVQNCSKTRMIKSDSSLTDVQPINRNSRVVPLTRSWTSYPESEMRSRTTAFCNRDERGLDGWAPPTLLFTLWILGLEHSNLACGFGSHDSHCFDLSTLPGSSDHGRSLITSSDHALTPS